VGAVVDQTAELEVERVGGADMETAAVEPVAAAAVVQAAL
jgi:hypothetical protein